MTCKITQKFGENKNNSYANAGLKGHTGVDEYCGYGTPIESPIEGLVYKVINDQFPANDDSGFWGIFVIFEHRGQLKEFLIGHPSQIFVRNGERISKGQIVGLEGNKGLVFKDGVEITLAMQKAGDKRGSHRHYQTRLIKRVEFSYKQCLSSPSGYGKYRDENDNVFEIIDYDNGFNGCVDCQDVLDEYAKWKETPPPPLSPTYPTQEQKTAIIKALDWLKLLLVKLLK